MKVESLFYLGVTAFFVVIGTIYWFTSYEDAGTTMLAASALLGLFAGGYLLLQARRFPPRPEDRPDATLAEGAGPVDKFPASTVWPFVFGFGATVFATGLAAVAVAVPLGTMLLRDGGITVVSAGPLTELRVAWTAWAASRFRRSRPSSASSTASTVPTSTESACS